MSVALGEDGAVAVLTLDLPASLDALDLAARQEFADRAHEVQDDEAVRAVVLTGAGRAFCPGGDITAMRERPDAVTARTWLRTAHSSTLALLAIEEPLLVTINGVAAGVGLALKLTDDVRMAAGPTRAFGLGKSPPTVP